MAQKKEDKSLLNSLRSKDEKVVLKALKSSKSKGDVKMIPQILDLAHSPSEAIRKEAQDVLNSLKISESLPLLIQEAQKSPQKLRSVLEAAWNTGISVEENLGQICELASKHPDYSTFVELYSLVTEYEGDLLEEQVMDGILALKNLLVEQEEAEYRTLVIEIVERLEALNERL